MIVTRISRSVGVELCLLGENHGLLVELNVARGWLRQVAICIGRYGSFNAAHLPDPLLEPRPGCVDVSLVYLAFDMPGDGTLNLKNP